LGWSGTNGRLAQCIECSFLREPVTSADTATDCLNVECRSTGSQADGEHQVSGLRQPNAHRIAAETPGIQNRLDIRVRRCGPSVDQQSPFESFCFDFGRIREKTIREL